MNSQSSLANGNTDELRDISLKSHPLLGGVCLYRYPSSRDVRASALDTCELAGVTLQNGTRLTGRCSTCYRTVQIQSTFSWRAPFIVQAIVGAILATSRIVLPESPRWLLSHGRREKAIIELKRLDFSAVEAEKDILGPAAEQQISLRRPGPIEGLVMIFRKPYRKSTLLALYVLGVVQLSGIDGVLYVSVLSL